MQNEFEKAVQKYIQHVEMIYGASTTAKHYASDLAQFSQVIEKAPREVTAGDVTEFIKQQLEAELSRGTVNRRLATLSGFFEYLADEAEDESWKNPVVWRLHRLETGEHLPRDLSEQTVRKLWSSVEQGPVRDQAMVALMLDVGLRAGEVIELKLEDFEPAQSAESLSALRVTGKGDKERRVWLVPETSQLLESYLEERAEVADQHLFITRRQKGFSLRGLQDRVKHYTKEAGLASSDVSCHRLRHTFARRMAEARMPLPSLSHWLGHSHLKTTQVYIDGANPALRTDYEAAMKALSRTAECADELVVQPVAEASSDGASAAETVVSPAYRPGLTEEEIQSCLSHLPLWLQLLLMAFISSQQLRWKAYPRRRRAQQWLSELRRTWEWMLEQRDIQELADLQKSDFTAYLEYLHDNELSAHTINHPTVCNLRCEAASTCI